jgi:uncharacterized protein YigA (DUF484 family)
MSSETPSSDKNPELKASNVSTLDLPEPMSMEQRMEEAAIAAYLREHPEFFERNENLLNELRLPHPDGSHSVSLVERQLVALRDKNYRLEHRLADFIEIGRENDVLIDKIHRLGLRLVKARQLPGIFTVVENSLRDDFGVDMYSLFVTRNSSSDSVKLFPGNYIHSIERENSEFKTLFQSILDSSQPKCGRLSKAQNKFLFTERQQNEIGSAALIPLGDKGEVGLMAVGSRDVNHFNPSASTDFLARMGELVSQVIVSH